MERQVVDLKLESLRRCIARIVSKQPFDVQRLTTDYDLQDIISVNLERAVQATVDLASILLAELDAPAPNTMSESFLALHQAGVVDKELADRMRKAVGLRNILVHAYSAIDWRIVHAVATQQLDDLRNYARAVDVFVTAF